MSYIVHVTALVEGNIDEIEFLINEYRYKCLKNQKGMKEFFVCRHPEQENLFLYTQIFNDEKAHKIHIEGNDPKWFFRKMEEKNYRFQGQWLAGKEIENMSDKLLN